MELLDEHSAIPARPKAPARSPAPFSLEAASVDGKNPGTPEPWSPLGLRRHHEIVGRVSNLFRRKRMRSFLREFNLTREMRVLDVGGLPRFWNGTSVEAHITMINLQPLPPHEARLLGPNQEFGIADGTALPWGDKSFDLVFSNSVIEHLGSWEKQIAFARECQRVGRTWWVQTPAREFPIEPHYAALFVHWFPKTMQIKLLRRFSLWGWLARPTQEAMEASLAELRLLKLKEFRGLFPESRIRVERFFGLPKSYVAYKV